MSCSDDFYNIPSKVFSLLFSKLRSNVIKLNYYAVQEVQTEEGVNASIKNNYEEWVCNERVHYSLIMCFFVRIVKTQEKTLFGI